MDIKTKTFERKDYQKLVAFLKNAYDDYLSARILLNHNLILQGTILANISIEKYFKAILVFKGDKIKRTHSIVGMLTSIKNFDTKLYNDINKDFIKTVDSCYRVTHLRHKYLLNR